MGGYLVCHHSASAAFLYITPSVKTMLKLFNSLLRLGSSEFLIKEQSDVTFFRIDPAFSNSPTEHMHLLSFHATLKPALYKTYYRFQDPSRASSI